MSYESHSHPGFNRVTWSIQLSEPFQRFLECLLLNDEVNR